VPRIPVAACMLTALLAVPVLGAESESFESLLERTTLAQIEAVQKYVAEHPEADDVDDAYTWLFTTARNRDLEVQVAKSAEAYLAREADQRDEMLAQVALAIRSLAWARTGEHEAALADFKAVIDAIPVRAGTSAVSVAIDLANAFQMAGKPELARGVYEELEKTFFLNPEVRQYTESRLAKLNLVGDAPPALNLDDLDGEAVDLSAYEGKVVLLDFWATNCGPCLEMIPRLKTLHAELQPAGFEIVGLTLDDDADLVREFTKQQQMPWRQAMATENGAKAVFTYHAETIPTLYLIGRDGKIVASDLRGATLETLIRRLVAEKAKGEGKD
jgi:thiol-disulfide isomerase/thioredoxin